MSASVSHPTLLDQVAPARAPALRNVGLAVAGSALLFVSAKVQVPFYPVPITLQTFAVLMLGMAFGARLGGATVLLYLLEGAAGLPVFAGTPDKGLGLAYMVGPTGGYLVGFMVAAGLCGALAERGWDRRFVSTTLAMLLGNVVIYAFGIAWLGTVVGWDRPVFAWGMPSIPGDLFKILLAASLLPMAWKFLRR